ncbi:tetratricopeptide repeat protein [Rubrobacter tropicus]|uniref:Tetratricopeptide repeat protein n=1 Tax=Rubrobacter tropicus TaxID=2653851 RepID=A0A6G8Q769_9ACTN|nr:tetratricopeptide repeat protein [Rubrobacter tropicus]QIN82325.1 tetratricopeptide repeat protein [Rubrobacter tropicus]
MTAPRSTGGNPTRTFARPGRTGGSPLQLSSFVGREREIGEVEHLLEQTRLLTLTGSGGAGKTRLALAAVDRVAYRFADGVAWVWLSGISEGDLVPGAVASAVGAREAPGLSPVESAVECLEDGEFLLVLDNCEHLVEECAALADLLLRSCPGLKLLTTSRELLNVAGEVAWRVPSLSLPDPKSAQDPADLLRFGAVRLFVERAAAAAPGFALDKDNAAAVVDVCERLDGIPLAIELAAARVKVLSVEQVDRRLDDALGLLTEGRRSAVPRHRTLRGALDWSHELLPEQERVLFRRLAVFVDGFGIGMAEKVCAGDGLEEDAVLLLLSRLVDKSLVYVVDRDGEARYRLLAMVRQYAQEKLGYSSEGPGIRRRHAASFVEFAERAEPELLGAGQEAWLDRLESDLGNLRAAMGWALGPAGRDAETGLRLAGALWRFCYLRGHYGQGRGWLEGALALEGPAPAAARAKALTGAGVLALLRCDYERAEERLGEGLTLHRELGDRPGEASALQMLGSVARERGRYARAEAYHEESLALWRGLGDGYEAARSLNYLGFVAWLQEKYARTVELCESSLETFRDLGDAEGVTWALINLGSAALYGGEPDRARTLLEEALSAARRVGYREGVAWSLNQLGAAAHRSGDGPGAGKMLRESLKVHRELGDRWRIASVIEGLATAARVLPERSARLFGAAEALRESLSAPIPPVERADRDDGLAAARAALGEERFEKALAAGRAVGLEEATALAMQEAPAPRSAAPMPHGLSAREVEVLGLVAEGLTNAEVAEKLFLSPRTVGHHLRTIYRKLGVPSRAAAAKAALERGLI